MDLLSRVEEVILLAVYQLGDEAYGVPIRKWVAEMMGKKMSIGAIYVPLDRLTKRGFLTAVMGHPTPERGGRRKRYYRLTPEGMNALNETRQFQDKIWARMPALR